MPTVTYTDYDGTEVTLDGTVGDSVMETAVRNGLPGIVAECGGSMACGTCHVFVCPQSMDQLKPMGELEDEMLDGTAVEREENSRLSCQLTLTKNMDLHVQTPETQL